MALTFVDESLFPMGRNTYMWISVLSFTFSEDRDDRELLASLIESPFYAHSYAWPFDLADDRTEPTIHGPWWRDRISVERFTRCTPDEAGRILQSWADDQDWTDPDFKQPADARQRLAQVKDMLALGSLYRLDNPDRDDWHDWGGVVGKSGFHEFAVIDRREQRLRLVVAADD